MAGANSCAQASRPCARCKASRRRSVPGTPTLAPPKMASPNCHRPVVDQEPVGLGRRGRGFAAVVALELLLRPHPSAARTRRRRGRRIAARPGSARVARRSAASAALPPARSICSPASTASGLAAETMCDLAVTAAAGAQPQVVARSGCTSRSCERAPAVRPISATSAKGKFTQARYRRHERKHRRVRIQRPLLLSFTAVQRPEAAKQVALLLKTKADVAETAHADTNEVPAGCFRPATIATLPSLSSKSVTDKRELSRLRESFAFSALSAAWRLGA